MKKIWNLFSLLLLLQLNLAAQNNNGNDDRKKYEFTKTKTYSKSYTVAASDKLDIKNRFGGVEIRTWNKNEIKVDVNITTTAQTADWVASVLDDIQVADNKTGNIITFKTLFVEDLDKKEGNKKGKRRYDKYVGKNSHQTMEVNYTVYMPETNALKVDDEFGAITVPDFKGEIEAQSKFGSLNIGIAPNIKKAVVEFGSGVFGNIANCTVNIKFSKSEFKKISGNMKLYFEFSDAAKINFDNSLTALQVSSSYSTVNLRPSNDLSVSYTINTSYGSFVNRSAIKFEDNDESEDKSPKFDFKYTGKSGAGTAQVKASTDYGKIILGEPNPEDMREKKKSKSVTL
jgi:hypothetical protein